MTKIRLNWKSLLRSSNGQFLIGQDGDERVECLQGQYAEIFFKSASGTVKCVTAKLHLKENATNVFRCAVPVPYALRLPWRKN